jgi:hypothetical protein
MSSLALGTNQIEIERGLTTSSTARNRTRCGIRS